MNIFQKIAEFIRNLNIAQTNGVWRHIVGYILGAITFVGLDHGWVGAIKHGIEAILPNLQAIQDMLSTTVGQLGELVAFFVVLWKSITAPEKKGYIKVGVK